MLSCSACGLKYEVIYPETDQASRCSVHTYLYEGKLMARGSYGSYAWDLCVLEIKDPSRAPGETLCDDCVTSLVTNGSAVVIGRVA